MMWAFSAFAKHTFVRITRLVAFVGVGLTIISLSSVTVAAEQSAANEVATQQPAVDRERAAQEQYELGAELFRQQRYLEAIDKFNRANTLRPDSRLYFNIGLAFDRAGDVSNALSNYRSYIFDERGNEHTERVAARVSELEKELAKTGAQQVTIRSTPNQAQVTIDGQTVGVTPWTADLEPGFYRVTLTHSGFETARLEFSLSLEAALTLSSTLERLPGPTGAPSLVAVQNERSPAHRSTTSPVPRFESLPVENDSKPEPESDGSKIPPWIAVGTGTALGLAALGFELDRRDAISDARGAGSRSAFDDNVERMQRDQTLARVFGTIAVTGVVVGVIWLLAPDDSSDDEHVDDRTSYLCGSSGCNWGVRF